MTEELRAAKEALDSALKDPACRDRLKKAARKTSRLVPHDKGCQCKPCCVKEREKK